MGFRHTTRGVRPGDLADVLAVAERKIRTFQGNSTPDAEAEGDLWLQPIDVDGVDYFLIQRAAAPGTAAWTPIAIMADKVRAGALDGETITGTWFRTDITGPRVEIGNPNGVDVIWLYQGDAGENPARIWATGNADRWQMSLWGGYFAAGWFPQVHFMSESQSDPTGQPSELAFGGIARYVVDLIDGGRFAVRDGDAPGLPEAFTVDMVAMLVDIGAGFGLGTNLRDAVDERVRVIGDARYAPI